MKALFEYQFRFLLGLIIGAAGLFIILTGGPAHATGGVHVEWMRGTTVYGAQTITATSSSVATGAAPDFGGGVPGVARITVTQGAVVVTWGPGATATQINGIRLEAGAKPLNIPVNVGDKVAIIEATDAQSMLSVLCVGGCGGGGTGTVTSVASGNCLTGGPITITGTLLVGCSSAQALAWNSDAGLSRASADFLYAGNGTPGDASATFGAGAFTIGAGAAGQWNSTALSFGNTGLIGWTASGNATLTLDTGISRDSAGVVDIGTGAQGNAGGSLKLAGITISGMTASTAACVNGSKALITCSSTGTGLNVQQTSPALITPALGAATATSINGLVVTSTLGTLTLANNAGAVLTTSGNFADTLIFPGAWSYTFPNASATLARSDAAQTLAGIQTFSSAPVLPAASLPLTALATQAIDTVLVNSTASPASPVAYTMVTCSVATKAVKYTVGTGFGCNSAITATAVSPVGVGVSATLITVTAGGIFGTGPTIVPNGTLAGVITVGTSPAATAGAIVLPAATTGWHCSFDDITTLTEVIHQTASTTTGASFIAYVITTGVAGAPTAADKLNYTCTGY